MAQFRFSAAIISRSSGQSVVAAAAYRAGQKLLDERTGDIKDYSRRGGVLNTLILTPENVSQWMLDRQRLWNQIEHREDQSTRRNQAQLARSLELSLPHELTHEQHIELLRDYFKTEYVALGMIADIAIHAPPERGDGTNHHAHVLLTMRNIEGDGFGAKNRDWNQKALIEHWRERWADYQNRALEKYGHEARVDHRSLEDQGIDREPTKHLGPNAQALEDQGVATERGDENRRRKGANDNREELKAQLADINRQIAEIERIQKIVAAVEEGYRRVEQGARPEPQGPDPEKRRQQSDADGPEAAPTPGLQPKDARDYRDKSAPPATAGAKAPSMPDDLSKQQEHAAQQDADRQKKAQDDEQARQNQAGKDESDRLQKLRDQDTRRVEDLAKQNAARLAAQAEEMRQEYARLHSEPVRKAQFDAHNAEMYRRAQDQKRKEDIERQQRLEEKAREGPIADAGARYAQALGRHYDLRDPYGSLAKSAMAEYAAFRRDRESYDNQIAKTTDPIERQALDLRKRIEGADYLAMTGDRIATMSEIITGRRNSQEAVKERNKASDCRLEAQDLRQQLRELQRERTPEKSQERTGQQPETTRAQPPGSRRANQYDELTKRQDEIAKAKEREKAKDPEREKQQERERELQRKRDRER